MSGSVAPPTWEDPRRVLSRHGLSAQKRYSQNFLTARSVVEAIGAAIDPGQLEEVVEIGPGVGTLTSELLRRGARVVAIEKDPRMLAVLEAELAGQPLRLVRADATELDLRGLAMDEYPTRVAGNLPYAITGPILRRLVEQRALVASAVIMVQREVRDRLLAPPGEKTYGALTVFVRAGFDVERVLSVSAGSFHPPPRVESAVVRLVPRAEPRAEESPAFVAVVRAAFEQRRKTLRNALSVLSGDTGAALAEVGIDPQRRGETLDIEEFDALAQAYSRRMSLER